jgi:hypothetical protein
LSTTPSGVEDMVGQNLTPGAEYPIFNTAVQKFSTLAWHQDKTFFPGLVRDGAVRGGAMYVTDVQLIYLRIVAEGDAPVGSSFTLQLVVAGVAAAQVFSLGATLTDSGLIVPTSPIYVTAGQIVSVQIGSGNQASDIVVYRDWQKVIQ